jgi:hypothetical protein
MKNASSVPLGADADGNGYPFLPKPIGFFELGGGRSISC